MSAVDNLLIPNFAWSFPDTLFQLHVFHPKQLAWRTKTELPMHGCRVRSDLLASAAQFRWLYRYDAASRVWQTSI
jgi:hypothetical protein